MTALRTRRDPKRFLAMTTATLIAVAAFQAASWVVNLAAFEMPELPAGHGVVQVRLSTDAGRMADVGRRATEVDERMR